MQRIRGCSEAKFSWSQQEVENPSILASHRQHDGLWPYLFFQHRERLVCRKKHKNCAPSILWWGLETSLPTDCMAPSRDIAKGFEVLETHVLEVIPGSNRKMSTIGSYCCLCTFMSVCMCVCALVLAVDSNVYISHHQYSVILMGFPLKNFLRRSGYTSMESYER